MNKFASCTFSSLAWKDTTNRQEKSKKKISPDTYLKISNAAGRHEKTILENIFRIGYDDRKL